MSPDEYAAEKENASTRQRKAESYVKYVVECLTANPDMSAIQLYDWLLEKRNGTKLSFKPRAFRNYKLIFVKSTIIYTFINTFNILLQGWKPSDVKG